MGASLFVPLSSPFAYVPVFMLMVGGMQKTLLDLKIFFYRMFFDKKRSDIILVLCILGFSLPAALGLTRNTVGYDSDLYISQAVRWLVEYGSPFGLGNLHNRLGQTSLWFVFVAQCKIIPFEPFIASIYPSFYVLLSIPYFVFLVLKSQYKKIRVYSCLIIIYITIQELWGVGVGVYYDQPAILLYLIALAEILSCFLASGCIKNVTGYLVIVFFVATGAFLVKPTSVPILFFIIAYLGYHIWCRHLSKKNIFLILLFPAVSAVIWMARNIVLTGWPIFPLPVLGLPVDWLMSAESLLDLSQAVTGWARSPGAGYLAAVHMDFGTWFLPWLGRNIQSKVFWIVAILPFIVGSFLWAVLLLKKFCWKKLFFFLLSFAVILYWGRIMPDIRFGHAFFWGYMSLGLAFFYDEFIHFDLLRPNILYVFFGGCLLAMYVRPIYYFTAVPNVEQSKISFQKDIKEIRMHPGSEDTFILYIPQNGDRCGLSILPCTPYIDDKLYLRNVKELKSGFKIKADVIDNQ